MKPYFRALSLFLHLFILAGLFWTLQDPSHLKPQVETRPFLLFLEDASLVHFAQETLSSLSLPENSPFLLLPNNSKKDSLSWQKINWDFFQKEPHEKDFQKFLFGLPLHFSDQDIFAFSRSPLPQTESVRLLAELFEANRLRLFLFTPQATQEPLSATIDKPSALLVRQSLQLEVKRTETKIEVLCTAQSLEEPVSLYWNETLFSTWNLTQQDSSLQTHSFALPLPPGTHVIWAKSKNILAQTSIHIQPPLQILNLDQIGENLFLETALRAQKMDVFTEKSIPEHLFSFQVVLLGEKTANRLSVKEAALLQQYVQNGGTLLFLQGESDLLPKYLNWFPFQKIQTLTPPEEEAPEPENKINTPPSQEKEKDLQEGQVLGQKKIEESSLCLLIILDRSASMQGDKLELAKQSAIACLKELKSEDLLGVITFNQFSKWILFPTPITRKNEIIQAIQAIQAEGDTFMYPAMADGYQELKKLSVTAKHIILLSDGYSVRANYRQLIEEMVQDQITLSTIGIGADFDHGLLASFSEWGKGRFYFTSDFDRIAHYVLLDTKKVVEELRGKEDNSPQKPKELQKKPKIADPFALESLFPPTKEPQKKRTPKEYVVRGEGPLFLKEQPPPVAIYRKAIASERTRIYATVEGEPLMGVERIAMGKVLHFLGRMEDSWAPLWLQWKQIAPFWAQIVRHLALEKKAVPELPWKQSSSVEKTTLAVTFPFFLKNDQEYFLEFPKNSFHKLEFISPTTLQVVFPFPGTGFYRFKVSTSAQETFSFAGILYPNEEKKETVLPATLRSQKYFTRPWSPRVLPPVIRYTQIRYFSALLAFFVFLILMELFFRKISV